MLLLALFTLCRGIDVEHTLCRPGMKEIEEAAAVLGGSQQTFNHITIM